MTILKALLITLSTVLIIGCGTKTPFKAQEPIKDAALVYVYVSDVQSDIDHAMEDAKYKIQINDKNVKGWIKAGEYKVFDMKPATVLFTIIRREIESLDVKLNLEAGKTYYLKTQSGEFGGVFTFKQVSYQNALNDLSNSKLAGSFTEDLTKYVPEFAGSTAGLKDEKPSIPALTESQIDALIEKKMAKKASMQTNTFSASTPSVTTKSTTSVTGNKLYDIRNAYEMKKQGILSEEEFLKMKSEILAK